MSLLKTKVPGSNVLRDKFFQAWLVDGDLASLQLLDPFGVIVDEGDGVSDFGESRSGDQTYIASAYNRDFHSELVSPSAVLASEPEPTSPWLGESRIQPTPFRKIDLRE